MALIGRRSHREIIMLVGKDTKRQSFEESRTESGDLFWASAAGAKAPISGSSSLVTFTHRGPLQGWDLGPPMRGHLSRSARPLTCPYLTSPLPALQKEREEPPPHSSLTLTLTLTLANSLAAAAARSQAQPVERPSNLSACHDHCLGAWNPVLGTPVVLGAAPGTWHLAPGTVQSLPPFLPRTQRNAMQRHESLISPAYHAQQTDPDRRTNRLAP